MTEELFKGINRIIVHGNCPDGMASAILLYDALKIEPEFHSHGTKAFQNLKVTPRTLFCDISPPDHLAVKFNTCGGVVLDHHRATRDTVKKFGERGIFADEDQDPGVSGAYLAYREIFVPAKNGILNTKWPNAERFARLAGIRDCWLKNEPDWALGCSQAAALTFYPWKYWKNRVDNNGRNGDGYLQFRDEMELGNLIYENRLNRAKEAADKAFVTQVGKYQVAVFNDSDKLASDVSEILRGQDVNIIAGFFYSKAHRTHKDPVLCYTLRSDGSFDVSDFAVKLGGGGHTMSAGYRRKPCYYNDPFSMFINDLEQYGMA